MLPYTTKGNFADVTKLRIFRFGDCPGLSAQSQGKHKSLFRRGAVELESAIAVGIEAEIKEERRC